MQAEILYMLFYRRKVIYMIGVIVNTVAVLIGSGMGPLLKKGIPEKWTDLIMKGIGLCTIYIGMSSAFEGSQTLVLIVSIVLGVIIGAALDLDRRLNSFAERLEKRFSKEGEKVSVAEGFVTSSLLFCVGALTVVGSLQAGLTGDNEMLFTKSTLDFISSIVFAASLGIGVMFSAGFVFVFQGLIVVCAGFLSPLLSDAIIAEMTSAGGLLIFALGLNLLGITKLKVIKDDKTGIEINYNDEYDSDTEIKVEEQFSGKSFQLINTEFGKVNSKIYDIATYKDGVKVQPNGEITVKVPLPDGFTTNKVFVCYVDSVSGKVTKIPCEVKDGYVIFKTNHFSEYAIVEQSANVKSVSVSDITLNYKKSATIKPTIKADEGAKYTVKYSSSNTKVATVDENGKVYAAKKGSATITCTVTDSNGNTVQDTCKVTVKYSFGQWLIKILLFGWIWY